MVIPLALSWTASGTFQLYKYIHRLIIKNRKAGAGSWEKVFAQIDLRIPVDRIDIRICFERDPRGLVSG